MRGIQFLKFQESQNCRIIPAHAGNTIFFLLTRRESEDHPRSCGEYSCRQAVNSIRQGSSPLMRGIPLPKRYRLLLQRIIPAHAGNTSFRPVCTSRCTDHPRSCGEYVKIIAHMFFLLGSSPLMRGILTYSDNKTTTS